MQHFREHHQPVVASGVAACLKRSGKPSGKARSKPVKALCQIHGLSRASYYRWRAPQPRPVELELRDALQRVALEFPAYRYRLLTAALQRQHWEVNHKPVPRLMRHGSLCLRRRKFVVTTDSRHDLPVYPNLAREITPLAVNPRTSPTPGCAGSSCTWALGRTLEAELALAALRMALRQCRPEPGLVHHSNRGVQYACAAYTDLLRGHGIRISMSRSGTPWSPWVRQPVKTLFAVRWKRLDRPDHCTAN